MALPFATSRTSRTRRRDQVVAIDLGSRFVKAVQVQKKGVQFQITRATVFDSIRSDKGWTAEVLTEVLQSAAKALDSRTKVAVVALGASDSVLRPAELPMVTVPEMRTLLKYKAKDLLQQDMPKSLFDCHILPPKNGEKFDPGRAGHKCRVLVGAAREELVNDLVKASKAAGLALEMVVPNLMCVANLFELAEPEVFANEVVALVDLGFKQSTICILAKGDFALSRVVALGGDRLTHGLSEAMGIGYDEAEGIKVGLAGEVQSSLEPLLAPLGRELRASIDFFEHQEDKTVTQAFFCGGGARSEALVQALRTELMVPAKAWNPAAFLSCSGLPPQQLADFEPATPQLAVALGAAASAL
jgi:type IV pilus assembly protein PilM